MQRTSSTNIRNRRNAFTLIELLVVIAIISLLAAILFPVFSGARDRARQASCTSNLKQIYTALRLYNQDFDGRYPEGAVLGSSLFRAVEDKYSMPTAIRAYTKNDNLWFCPSQYQPHRELEHPLPGYYWTLNATLLKTPDTYEDGSGAGNPQYFIMENYVYKTASNFDTTGSTGISTWGAGSRHCAHSGGTRYNFLGMDGRVKLWPAEQSAKLCATS